MARMEPFGAAGEAEFRPEGVARCGAPHRGGRRDSWVGALLPEDFEESA